MSCIQTKEADHLVIVGFATGYQCSCLTASHVSALFDTRRFIVLNICILMYVYSVMAAAWCHVL